MSNTVTSAFIDLATFDEIEKYLYNGPTAITYFVRCVRKSTWFAQVPVPLTQNAGNPQFNGDVAFQISRAGDYLLHVWLRATLPAISISQTSSGGTGIRWAANIGHNLIDLTWISFNDLKVQEFDSFWLDMWSAFTVSASKRNGYNNMIGNVADLTNTTLSLPAYTVNIPLPYFFTRDTGIALPTAALPYNEMRIHFEFRNWNELLIFDGNAGPNDLNANSANPQLTSVQLWANYAVVSNEERVKMGKCPRDMVIEQVQRHGGRAFNAASVGINSNAVFDIRFSHSIKALFWNVCNSTICNSTNGNQAREWSNYTTGGVCSDEPNNNQVINGLDGTDPISLSSLLYENTYRLFDMGSDYFSLVQPWFFWTSIPEETGYHVYSFALEPESMDPTASTNFGKLTNVSLQLTPSQDAVDAVGSTIPQQFQVYIRALNFNVVRVSGGALGLKASPQKYCASEMLDLSLEKRLVSNTPVWVR
uniref:Major capsid protein n=1 Tax=Marseillevirus LCMAC201 TaxID=2506605 RepID=A0A481YWW2_9VIRU|nr:MAG: major capsid protein [Marseillevirus LCMAC201]